MARGGKTVNMEALSDVAKQLFKHQDFKLSTVTDRVKSTKFAPTTIITYHTGMRRYLATGQADTNRAPRQFYELIKEYMSTHVAKLTPSESDKAQPYMEKPRRNGRVKTVVKATKVNRDPRKIEIKPETLEQIKKLPEKVHTVGLLLKDGEDTIIRVFENEDVLKGFTQAFKYLDKNNELTFDVVDVTYSKK